MAVMGALAGMVTAVGLNWLLAVLNPAHTPKRALLIGVGTTLGVVLIIQFALQAALAALQAAQDRPLPSPDMATYLFWFGLPSLIYICAGAVGAWQLNLHRATGPQIPASAAGGTLAHQSVSGVPLSNTTTI
jgi:hypothetical protein